MRETTRVEIGPIPADLAAEWLENSHRIVREARHQRHDLSVELHRPILDVLDTLLLMWKRTARETDPEPFTWSGEVEVDRLLAVAEEWRSLAAMTDDDLATLGCEWGHPRTLPVFHAIADGLDRALGRTVVDPQ